MYLLSCLLFMFHGYTEQLLFEMQLKGVSPIIVHPERNVEKLLNFIKKGAHITLILTEWNEFKDLDICIFEENMEQLVLFDGRNGYDLKRVKNYHMEYHSMERPWVKNI